PYRYKHFERGRRVSLPGSWRRFLFILYAGRCANCNELVKDIGELDHVRPLRPEESRFHSSSSGNSTIFNLCLLCRTCNRQKYRHFAAAPEAYIPELVWDRRFRLYLRISLSRPPSEIEHSFPLYCDLPGEELIIR